MKTISKIANLVGCLLLTCQLSAQEVQEAPKTIMTESGLQTIKPKEEKKACKPPRDGFYDRTLHKEKRPLAYDYVHEKDVFWEKRIWREIDLKQKKNHTFTYVKRPFISILMDAANANKVTFYSTWDDEFTQPLNAEDIANLGGSYDTTTIYDPETFIEKVVVVKNEFNPEDVVGYRLKEVWFFDEETSSLGVRILGIAPVKNTYGDNGELLHQAPMFWAYYPELRPLLAQEETFNPANDAIRLSWDDLFEARLFASHVTKENNVYDRRIKDYVDGGVNQLLEGEKIEETIRNFEHDLYSY